MSHLRAWAAAAVTAALVMGAGCVTRQTYKRDLAVEQVKAEQAQLKTAVVQAKLDQANQDVKKAWDALAEEAADYTANQKAADAARGQVAGLKKEIERLQNSAKETDRTAKAAADKAAKASKDDADKLKALQDQFDAVQKEKTALLDLVERQKAQIAELKGQPASKSPVPAPPVQPMPMAPTTSAPATTGK